VCERVYVVCVCVHVCVCVCVCVCACVLCYVCVATYSTQMKNHGVTFHLVNTHIHTHTHTHTHTHAHTHSLFLTVSVSHRVHTRRIRAFTRRATTSLSNVPKSIIKINFQWLSPVTIVRAFRIFVLSTMHDASVACAGLSLEWINYTHSHSWCTLVSTCTHTYILTYIVITCPHTYILTYMVSTCTVGFRDIKTTEMTQPACFQAHTDEASTQPASVGCFLFL